MRAIIAAASLALGCVAAWPPLVSAEHKSAEPRELGPSMDLGVDLRLGRDGFRLGGRLVGPEGAYGASLGGQARRNGFALDGRVEGPERAWNFRLDADVWQGSFR